MKININYTLAAVLNVLIIKCKKKLKRNIYE